MYLIEIIRHVLRWCLGWPIAIVLIGIGIVAWFCWWLFGCDNDAEEGLELVTSTYEKYIWG